VKDCDSLCHNVLTGRFSPQEAVVAIVRSIVSPLNSLVTWLVRPLDDPSRMVFVEYVVGSKRNRQVVLHRVVYLYSKKWFNSKNMYGLYAMVKSIQNVAWYRY